MIFPKGRVSAGTFDDTALHCSWRAMAAEMGCQSGNTDERMA